MKERGVSIKQIHACRLQVLSEIRLKDKYILDYICPISTGAGKIDNKFGSKRAREPIPIFESIKRRKLRVDIS